MLASPSYYILSMLAWYTPQVEQITRQMRHLTTLNMSLVCCMVRLVRLAYLILQTQTMDVEVFIHTQQLRTLWEDSRERMENFVRSPFLILATWCQINFRHQLRRKYQSNPGRWRSVIPSCFTTAKFIHIDEPEWRGAWNRSLSDEIHESLASYQSFSISGQSMCLPLSTSSFKR